MPFARIDSRMSATGYALLYLFHTNTLSRETHI
jgi:hypothetical protein